MTTEPMRRMVIASCEYSMCRRRMKCAGLPRLNPSYCLARAARCFDALLPLSDAQVGAFEASFREGLSPREQAGATIAAVAKAARGE